MKTQISFTTDLFESKTVGLDVTIEKPFGEDIAIWLAKRMKDSEFVPGEPFQTDSGWQLAAVSGGEKFAIDIEIAHDSIGEAQADWLITVRKERKWAILSSKDSPLRHNLCDLLQNLLRDETGIREIGWDD